MANNANNQASKEIVDYYEKLNTVIEMQKELLEMQKELAKKGNNLPLIVKQNKTSNKQEYHKNYYQNVAKKKQRDDYHCEICDCTIGYFSKTLHLKSKKHLKNLEKNGSQ